MHASRRRPARRGFVLPLLLLLLLIPAAAALLVLGVRTATVTGPSGSLCTVTSGESVHFLNVLKVQRGFPLYDRPTEPPHYPLALYNAGFYALYAAAAAPFGPDVADLARAARLFSLVLTALGLAATLGYGLTDLRRREPTTDASGIAPAMLLAAFATAFGGLPGWWVLSIRPDAAVAAFGAIALAAAFRIGPRCDLAAGLAAGTALALAWAFKQSGVLIFGGLCLSALVARRGKFLAGLAPPVLLTIALMHAALGPEYRYNTVFATSIAGFDVANLKLLAAHLTVKGIFPLTIAALGLAAAFRAPWIRSDERWTLGICAATTLFGGLAASLRNGSAMNYFFEFNAVALILSVIAARWLCEIVAANEPLRKPAIALLGIAALGASAQDAARLALPARFDQVQAKFNVDRRDELNRVQTLLQSADGPVYCQPALSGLAFGLPFPVYTLDDEPFFHRPAARMGLLNGPGVLGQMEAGHFRLMVVEAESEGLAEFIRMAGYVEQPGWTHLHVFTPSAVSATPDR